MNLPKTKMSQKEIEKERQETKIEIAAKIADFEKKQAILDFQLKQIKERHQAETATARAS
jgi:hypothetical protein